MFSHQSHTLRKLSGQLDVAQAAMQQEQLEYNKVEQKFRDKLDLHAKQRYEELRNFRAVKANRT